MEGSVMVGGFMTGERRDVRSDARACAGEGAVFGEDDDAAFAGDVAF